MRVEVRKDENGLWRVRVRGDFRHGYKMASVRDVPKRELRETALDLLAGLGEDVTGASRPK